VSHLIGAVDIGGTKIAVAAVTADGKIVERLECATAAREGFAPAMRRTKEMLGEISRRTGERFAGIGVAAPGPLDPLAGVIGNVGTLPGWQGGNITTELEQEFGLRVAVENDADSAALAEAAWGTAAGCLRFLYVTISTGIGAGILIDGRLYRGVGDAHPEIGHMVLDASGPICYCGAPGCWEVLASGTAMSAWMHRQAPERGELSAQQICELAAGGDELARRTVDREGYYIGLGLANLITIFTPDAIALGGGVMKNSGLFVGRARKVIRNVCTQVPADRTRIELASLGADTTLAGAARAWLLRFSQL
jgi:glucokinase